MVTTNNRHQNDDWFARGRSSYKQKLPHKFKKLQISVSHLSKNPKKADYIYAKGLLCMVTEASWESHSLTIRGSVNMFQDHKYSAIKEER